jgi:hypothetical protein
VLLIVHCHGFARRQAPRWLVVDASSVLAVSIPGSALQLNATWLSLEHRDHAMLQAAWYSGAWDLMREERRGCHTEGATEQAAMECRQAIAKHPLEGKAGEFMLADAPKRVDLMQLAERVDCVRWQFRPVKGGLWPQTGNDDTVWPDGGRVDDCPVPARPAVGPRVSRMRCQIGHSTRSVLL